MMGLNRHTGRCVILWESGKEMFDRCAKLFGIGSFGNRPNIISARLVVEGYVMEMNNAFNHLQRTVDLFVGSILYNQSGNVQP
jgi:hypothetical protein